MHVGDAPDSSDSLTTLTNVSSVSSSDGSPRRRLIKYRRSEPSSSAGALRCKLWSIMVVHEMCGPDIYIYIYMRSTVWIRHTLRPTLNDCHLEHVIFIFKTMQRDATIWFLFIHFMSAIYQHDKHINMMFLAFAHGSWRWSVDGSLKRNSTWRCTIPSGRLAQRYSEHSSRTGSACSHRTLPR